MSLTVFLSGGLLLELTISDNSQLGNKVVPVASVRFEDAFRDGMQLVLKRFVAGNLRWVGWKAGVDGKATVLFLVAENEEVFSQLKDFVNSGEALKRLQGIYRAFGFMTNFRVNLKRVDNSITLNPVHEYLLLPASLHSFQKKDAAQPAECTIKDPIKDSSAGSPERMTCPVPTLLDNLKRFEAEKVNIPPGEVDKAKQLVDRYIKDGILQYVKDNTAFILNVHYTGSSYEGLKTEHADEFDIMVQVQHIDVRFDFVDGVPGYAVMLPKFGKDSNFYHNLLQGDVISPFKFRSQIFFGLVQQAVNHVSKEVGVSIKVSGHGPAVQVDISVPDRQTISVDLVLCYMFDPGNHFVAKPFKEYADSDEVRKSLPYESELLWRQSFSLQEKDILKKMDGADQGCRHRCVRIIKTIFRNDATLKKLTSYHIKTTFLHYNANAELSWKDGDLPDRFLGLWEKITSYVRDRIMPHKFVSNLDLLDGFKESTLNNIQGRLENLLKKLKSPNEQNKVFSKLLKA